MTLSWLRYNPGQNYLRKFTPSCPLSYATKLFPQLRLCGKKSPSPSFVLLPTKAQGSGFLLNTQQYCFPGKGEKEDPVQLRWLKKCSPSIKFSRQFCPRLQLRSGIEYAGETNCAVAIDAKPKLKLLSLHWTIDTLRALIVRLFIHLLFAVIFEFIVATVGDEPAKANTKREENLSSGLYPNLETNKLKDDNNNNNYNSNNSS